MRSLKCIGMDIGVNTVDMKGIQFAFNLLLAMIISFENMLDSRSTGTSLQRAFCQYYTIPKSSTSTTLASLWGLTSLCRRLGDMAVKLWTLSLPHCSSTCTSFIKNLILIWSNGAEKRFQLRKCN